MLKACAHCAVEKEENRTNFHFKSKATGTFREICIGCWAIYHAKHYKKNKAKYLAKASIRNKIVNARQHKIINRYKRMKGCLDCGNKNPIVLEFDHLDAKDRNISTMIGMSWAKIKLEISKCVVRCANCLRIRHALNRQD